MTAKDKLRLAVVGVGAFGRNHARVCRDLAREGEIEFAGVCDRDPLRAESIATEFETQKFADLDALLARGKPHAAIVAVPTVSHLEVARTLMQAGVDVLIEKPLVTSLAEADELVSLAKSTRRTVQVGQLERFNPAVRATVPLLTQPMFFEIHRLSIFTPRSLDVDVVLDLMIHDLDIVLSFARSPVKEVRAVGLPILSDKVDIANVRLEFESGCVANFTASRVSTERVRKLRFFQPHQYLSLDYTRQDVIVFNVDAGSAAAGFSPTAFMEEAGEHPSSPNIKIYKPEIVREEPLRAELLSFISAVRERKPPLVTLEDGRRALAVALEILSAIGSHTRRFDLAVSGRGGGASN